VFTCWHLCTEATALVVTARTAPAPTSCLRPVGRRCRSSCLRSAFAAALSASFDTDAAVPTVPSPMLCWPLLPGSSCASADCSRLCLWAIKSLGVGNEARAGGRELLAGGEATWMALRCPLPRTRGASTISAATCPPSFAACLLVACAARAASASISLRRPTLGATTASCRPYAPALPKESSLPLDIATACRWPSVNRMADGQASWRLCCLVRIKLR
jgi:hypothetical protein